MVVGLAWPSGLPSGACSALPTLVDIIWSACDCELAVGSLFMLAVLSCCLALGGGACRRLF